MAGLSNRSSQNISIHALREEGDLVTKANELAVAIFLSTPSARRATEVKVGAKVIENDFYPRPPRGGRHGCGFAAD